MADNERVGAIRHNEGKPQLSFIFEFPNALTAVSKVSEMGAAKYERHNWKKGFQLSSLLDSALRHLLAFQNGYDNDNESGLPHLAHAAWNVLAMMENQVSHPALDNRYKAQAQKEAKPGCKVCGYQDPRPRLPEQI